MNAELLLSRIRIVLCRPSHPGNIGAAARAMKTMGLSDLRLVQPKQFPDPEADTRATGAVDLLQQAKIHDTLADALAGTVHAIALSARRRDLGPVHSAPGQAMDSLLTMALEAPVALVFGNETHGLSNEEVMTCQASVTIPTNPGFSSLNLGSAVQVMCYEARQRACSEEAFTGTNPKVTPFSSRLATHEEVEGLYGHLEQAMLSSGFMNPDQPSRLMAKLRRLFSRAGLEKDEVNILRGFLSSTEKPTRHGRQG